MIDKPLDQITQADIEALVTNGVKEDRTTEYKEALPGGGDGERKEFLADVVSLTMAGGDLILGVEEERDAAGKPTGVPKATHGVITGNVVADLLTLESAIRDGIAARINGVRTRHIDGFNRGPVLVIRIPQSLNTPHMVTYKGSSRFYGRTSAGKYRLDIDEIRVAFLASEAIPQRLREFRAERLNLILAGDTPIPLVNGPKIVLHVVPASALALTMRRRLDLHELPIGEVQPIYGGINAHRFNYDGRVAFSTRDYDTAKESFGYVQVFHTSAIEAVDTQTLCNVQSDGRNIPGVAFERDVFQALGQYLRAITTRLLVEPPIFAMLSLLGVRGARMALPSSYSMPPHYLIDRDNLVVPEVLIEDVTIHPATLLRPAFDIVWQSCGYPSSPNYADDGTWGR